MNDIIRKIEELTAKTNELGPFSLWEGYGKQDIRRPADVCITKEIGLYLMDLVCRMNPKLTIEIGAGFGISGMYLAALNKGQFVTFEANKQWAKIAQVNLYHFNGMVIDRPFDVHFLRGSAINLAFIDAIHTEAEVSSQFNAILPFMNNGTVIIDDIQAVRPWFDGLELPKHIDFNRLGVIECIPK